MSNTDQPFQTLGKHLRYLREQQSESLAEVSGAVEIEQNQLERIEAGHVRPDEEILMLLINHFNMQDQEAVQLWELAGYDNASSDRPKQEEVLQEALNGQKPVVILMGLDNRTMYTDSVHISGDTAGITINFGKHNTNKQVQPLASMGMSYEQAQQVLDQLQKAVLYGKHRSQPKQLPPSNQ